jgi:hypothetical protein
MTVFTVHVLFLQCSPPAFTLFTLHLGRRALLDVRQQQQQTRVANYVETEIPTRSWLQNAENMLMKISLVSSAK